MKRKKRSFQTAGVVPYSYEKFLVELGSRLRQARKDRGWTLRDMITQHGFHLAQWQNFEKGKAISVPSLLRMCDVFGLSLEELIHGLGQVDPPELAKQDVSSQVPKENTQVPKKRTSKSRD